jgi:hypothetical protein
MLSMAQCTGIHVCADPGMGLRLGLVNVGEQSQSDQFVDDMAALASWFSPPALWLSGQSVWGGQPFFKAGVILADLHLAQFAFLPSPPPEYEMEFEACLAQMPEPNINSPQICAYYLGPWWDSN